MISAKSVRFENPFEFTQRDRNFMREQVLQHMGRPNRIEALRFE